MIQRRTRFAAPFVLVAASCGGPAIAHENPPGPERRTTAECEGILPGSKCKPEYDGACAISNDTGCGRIGFDCIDENGVFVWKEQVHQCDGPSPPTP